jgi:hypothetical protein
MKKAEEGEGSIRLKKRRQRKEKSGIKKGRERSMQRKETSRM